MGEMRSYEIVAFSRQAPTIVVDYQSRVCLAILVVALAAMRDTQLMSVTQRMYSSMSSWRVFRGSRGADAGSVSLGEQRATLPCMSEPEAALRHCQIHLETLRLGLIRDTVKALHSGFCPHFVSATTIVHDYHDRNADRVRRGKKLHSSCV